MPSTKRCDVWRKATWASYAASGTVRTRASARLSRASMQKPKTGSQGAGWPRLFRQTLLGGLGETTATVAASALERLVLTDRRVKLGQSVNSSIPQFDAR